MENVAGDDEASNSFMMDPQYSMENYSMVYNNTSNSSKLIDPELCGNITPEYEQVEFIIYYFYNNYK